MQPAVGGKSNLPEISHYPVDAGVSVTTLLTTDLFKQDAGRIGVAIERIIASQLAANSDGPQSRFFVLTGKPPPELYRKSYGETNNKKYAR